jgi:SAM-dependent methyltransferase
MAKYSTTRPSLTQLSGMAARRLRLTGPAFRALERYRALRGTRRLSREHDIDPSVPAMDRLPLPPPLLRVQVSGDPDPDDFLRSGGEGARVLRETLQRHTAQGIEGLDAILDFGCGCGRIARHWATLDGPEVHGCDYNPRLVKWCDENLPFLHVQRNDLAPPLPYLAERFDFIYALSVFTHLSERMQFEWIAELRRIIRPGGFLLFTTHGDAQAVEHLTRPGRTGLEDYEAGRFVVTDQSVEGLNLCAAYHPHQWVVDRMLGGFELLESVPQGATMNGGQDLYFARRV